MKSDFNKGDAKGGLRLKDFEGRSLGEYAAWLERRLGLNQVNVSKIWSVRIMPSIPVLLHSKRKLISVIQENLEILKEYSEGEEIHDKEEVIVESIRCQWLFWYGIVQEQLVRLEEARTCNQLEFQYTNVENEKDEMPF